MPAHRMGRRKHIAAENGGGAGRPARLSAAWLLLALCLALSTFRPASGAARAAEAGPGSAASGYPYPDPGMPFERISLEDGLSQSSILSILQDSFGFLWFGTEDGLNRYDGYSFAIYRHDPDDPNSLSSNYITALAEGEDGDLWVGTDKGVNFFDRSQESFLHYRHDEKDPQSLNQDAVFSLCKDRSGVIWIGTASGVNWFDPQSGRLLSFRDNPQAPLPLRRGEIRAILETRSGLFWFGTAQGLVSYQPESEAFRHYQHDPMNPYSLSADLVLALMEDSAGTLWVGTRGGGISLLPPGGEVFTNLRRREGRSGSLSHDSVHALYEDRSGTVWIGTEGGGLNRYLRETNQFVHFEHNPSDDSSLSHNTILTIYEDNSGVLWVGAWGGGINKYARERKPFLHVRQRPGEANSLRSSHVWGFYQDDNGVLWIATLEGLSRLDRWTGELKTYRHHPSDLASLGSSDVQVVYRDSFGVLWAGTDGGGLNRFVAEKNGFVRYTYQEDDPGSLSSDSVTNLFEDGAGRLWVGTKRGLNLYNRETDGFTRIRGNGDFPLDRARVNDIAEDAQGNLWIGTLTGLVRYHPEREEVQVFRHDPADPFSLSEDYVLTVHASDQGEIWIGTGGGGLNRLDPQSGKFRRYYEKDGLPNNVVYGILEDRQGNLWMSTNLGLSRFDPQREVFRNYDVGDGLQSNEFNAGAYYQSPQGEMFFGGLNGFNAFNPEAIRDSQQVPPVVLTSLVTNEGRTYRAGELAEAGDITLRWPNHSIEFEFAALSYLNPEKNQYAYRLEGFDQGWNFSGNRRFGQYTNLPGGTYTLRVKGSNHDGVWNEAGTAVKIVVVPPFWQTSWYQVGLLLLLITVVFSGFRLWIKGVEKRNLQLELVVQERTRELEERTAESERRSREIEVLYRADQELYRNLQLDQVLQTLVDTAVEILEADKGSLLVWDERHERLVARAVKNFNPETVPRMTFAPGQGLAGWVAVTAEPAIILDARQDPRVSRAIIDLEGITAFMQVPIKVEGQVFGVFSVDFVQRRDLGQGELQLLTALAERAALAIQNAQLYENTQKAAVVEERSRLARELHDAVTQTLFSASLIAEALPGVWEQDPQDGNRLLQELRQLSRGALAEMRALLLELRPATLAEARLENLLRQLGDAVAGREGIRVSVSTEAVSGMPSEVRVAFYRIAQEALNNVVKHASASRVSIRLQQDPETVAVPALASLAPALEGAAREQAAPALQAVAGNGAPRAVVLIVQDDGQGFDPEQIAPEHLGLGIMRERAQSIGAELVVESQPGSGTQITVRWENNPDVGGQEEN